MCLMGEVPLYKPCARPCVRAVGGMYEALGLLGQDEPASG